MGITNDLYRAARIAADIRAINKGPKAVIHREVRKVAYRKVNGLLARALNRILR